MKEVGESKLNELGYHKVKDETDIFGRIWGITYFHDKEPIKITFDLIDNRAVIASRWGEAMYLTTNEYEAIARKNKELKNSKLRKQIFAERRKSKNECRTGINE